MKNAFKPPDTNEHLLPFKEKHDLFCDQYRFEHGAYPDVVTRLLFTLDAAEELCMVATEHPSRTYYALMRQGIYETLQELENRKSINPDADIHVTMTLTVELI